MDVKTQKKLNYLDETKQLIREAIEEKGQTISDADSFRSYADKIAAIETGGGGGTLVVKKGTFNATGTTQTVTHGLGTIPILALIYPTIGISDTSNDYLLAAVGLGPKIKELSGINSDLQYVLGVNSYTKTWMQNTPDYSIDTSNSNPIYKATESTIAFGYSSNKLKTGQNYTWIVVGFKEE